MSDNYNQSLDGAELFRLNREVIPIRSSSSQPKICVGPWALILSATRIARYKDKSILETLRRPIKLFIILEPTDAMISRPQSTASNGITAHEISFFAYSKFAAYVISIALLIKNSASSLAAFFSRYPYIQTEKGNSEFNYMVGRKYIGLPNRNN